MTYDKNVLRVLNGYINLSPTEKSIFIEEINRYQNTLQKGVLEENLRSRLDVGPTDTGYCKCCGRS